MSWKRWFGRGRADAEVREEMEFFVAEEIEENIARGMTRGEAHRQARIKRGNAQRVRESLWQQNTVASIEKIGRDLRYAVRTLLRAPGFSLIAIGVMALCIGAATSLFTVVRSVMLKPLPFADPDRLVMVYEHFRNPGAPSINGEGYNPVAPADFYDWRARTHGFADMAAWRYWQFNLTGEHGELPEKIEARGGSWNLFPLLGIRAAIGRTFNESEDRTDGDAVMLTWSLFERRFGGDAAIVGRQIHLDGRPYTVVGVLPKWFTYPDATVQVWVPFREAVPPEILQHHDFHFARVVARLRPDVSLAGALSQVGALQYQMHLEHPGTPVAEDVVSRTLVKDLSGDVRLPLTIMLCAAGCLLLIGCLNVANLMVARSAARQKEIAIRTALGGRRATLVREQLMESLAICAAGGVAGVLLSILGTTWLVRAWKNLPSAQAIQVDWVVIAVACGLAFVAALAAGLVPAISSTGKGNLRGLQASARTAMGSASRTLLRKALLTVEIAATMVLLIGAGLLLKSFWQLRTTNLGCVTNNVLTMGYSLPARSYDTPAKVNAFNESLLEQVRSLPGVRAAALGSIVPGAGYGGDDDFTILEHPRTNPGAPLPVALYRRADPGYFSALGIPLVSGRFFTKDDGPGHPKTVIISRALAKQYFPGEDPLGKHLHIEAESNGDFQIVGVVGDTLYQVGKPLNPAMYFPVLDGAPDHDLTLAVRTYGDPLAMSIPVQKVFAQLDAGLPVFDVLTMDQIVGDSLRNQSFSATLVLAFAMISLLLAGVGLYGVLSYLTAQRTSEIGVRMALGARREQVLRAVLLDGMRTALVGLAIGLGASGVIARVVQSLLYRTPPLDATVYAAASVFLLAAALVACLGPAWKASRLEPVEALRAE